MTHMAQKLLPQGSVNEHGGIYTGLTRHCRQVSLGFLPFNTMADDGYYQVGLIVSLCKPVAILL